MIITFTSMKKKFIVLSLLLLSFFSVIAQVHIPYTRLAYKAHYSFGPINVAIGTGEVTIQTNGKNFMGTLNGKSIPWRGRVYCISDTLKAEMVPTRGYSAESVKYVNGWYRKPKSKEYEAGQFNPDSPESYKNIKGHGSLDASDDTMEAITIMADMLALYYYAHEINFHRMREGEAVTLPIKTPHGKEWVRLTYEGISTLEIGERTFDIYQTVFEYSYKGEMSGYRVNLDIDMNNRIPLRFSSNLPIGHVEMTRQI